MNLFEFIPVLLTQLNLIFIASFSDDTRAQFLSYFFRISNWLLSSCLLPHEKEKVHLSTWRRLSDLFHSFFQAFVLQKCRISQSLLERLSKEHPIDFKFIFKQKLFPFNEILQKYNKRRRIDDEIFLLWESERTQWAQARIKSFLPHVKISNNEKNRRREKNQCNKSSGSGEWEMRSKNSINIVELKAERKSGFGWIIGIFFVSWETSEPPPSSSVKAGRQTKNGCWSGWGNTYIDRITEDTNHIMTKVVGLTIGSMNKWNGWREDGK